MILLNNLLYYTTNKFFKYEKQVDSKRYLRSFRKKAIAS